MQTLAPKPINVVSTGSASPEQKDNKSSSKIVLILQNKFCTAGVIAFFILALLVWHCLDKTIPGYDPAWHAMYSCTMRRFFTHAHEWNIPNLTVLLRQHFGYPAGGWIFNGLLKVVFGDGAFADRACLIVQTLVMAIGFYKLSMYTWSDRVKANTGLLFLLCAPLICGLEHLPLLDLLQTMAFTCYAAALMYWNSTKTWKSTLIAALFFGFYCTTKQIAMLFGAPVLVLLAVYSLYKRNYKEFLQVSLILAACPLFLLIWIIPNFAELKMYLSARGQIGPTLLEKLSMILVNAQKSSIQIWESVSPLTVLPVFLLFWRSNWKDNAQKVVLPTVAALGGFLLMIVIFYYNNPEARYYGAAAVAFSLFAGGIVGEAIKSSISWKRALATGLLLFLPVQMLSLNFSQAPVVKRPIPLNVDSKFDWFGLRSDVFLRSNIALDANKDSWKQQWAIDSIEKVDKIRFVYLNVLPSTWEYNQGSFSYLCNVRKSRVIPVTWRFCNPDMSDGFSKTPSDAATMDWFLVKTGFQGSPVSPQKSAEAYQNVVDFVEHSGDFALIDKTGLPDGSELKLYRKDYVKLWQRQARELRERMKLSSKAPNSI
ncbi:MAG: hypothetical protein K2X77_16210 [Candidatus Obscuribacterales bacterium]|nr:hypothetical protein [Candidatus Obscuribacterales bacterium]